MEFLHAAIALLASMVLVLAGLVGWLYWQQQRMIQTQSNLAMALGELARSMLPPPPAPEPDTEAEAEAEAELPEEEGPVPAPTPAAEEDDRVSVEQGPEVISGPPLDTDGLESKTKKELQELLEKRSIPYGKGDNKGVLISLLKATA
jgi:hypothetical protein